MNSNVEKSRFLLRLDSGVYKKLLQLSKNQKLSINSLCSHFIEYGLLAGTHDQKWIDEIVSAYSGEGLQAIILFGSQSRGEASASSDIDLLLVFAPECKITRSLYRKFEKLMDEIPNGDRYSIHCVSQPELSVNPSSFWFEITLDGKVLWKKNNQINDWLKKVKNVICSGKYVRKLSSGQPYWMENEK